MTLIVYSNIVYFMHKLYKVAKSIPENFQVTGKCYWEYWCIIVCVCMHVCVHTRYMHMLHSKHTNFVCVECNMCFVKRISETEQSKFPCTLEKKEH